MNTPTPVIPDVIAGITHQQVAAYFAELSKLAGFKMGYAAGDGSRLFCTYEYVAGQCICEIGTTPADAVRRHLEKRPATGLALARQKLAEAQALLLNEEIKASAS